MNPTRNSRSRAEEIIDAPDSGASEIREQEGILSQLFRRLLRPTGTRNSSIWNTRLNDLIRRNMASGGELTFSDKSNVGRALLSNYMTIKTFIRGLMFSRVIKYRLVLEAYTEDGEKHVIKSDYVVIGDAMPPITEDELSTADKDQITVDPKDDPDYVPHPRE